MKYSIVFVDNRAVDPKSGTPGNRHRYLCLPRTVTLHAELFLSKASAAIRGLAETESVLLFIHYNNPDLGGATKAVKALAEEVFRRDGKFFWFTGGSVDRNWSHISAVASCTKDGAPVTELVDWAIIDNRRGILEHVLAGLVLPEELPIDFQAEDVFEIPFEQSLPVELQLFLQAGAAPAGDPFLRFQKRAYRTSFRRLEAGEQAFVSVCLFDSQVDVHAINEYPKAGAIRRAWRQAVQGEPVPDDVMQAARDEYDSLVALLRARTPQSEY